MALHERHLACAEEHGHISSFPNAGNSAAQLPDVGLSKAKPSSSQRTTYLHPNEAQEDLLELNSSGSERRIKPSDGESLGSEGGAFKELQKIVVQTEVS